MVLNGLTQTGSLSCMGSPQVSLLGPALFSVFLYGLDDWIESIFARFTDGARMGGISGHVRRESHLTERTGQAGRMGKQEMCKV